MRPVLHLLTRNEIKIILYLIFLFTENSSHKESNIRLFYIFSSCLSHVYRYIFGVMFLAAVISIDTVCLII